MARDTTTRFTLAGTLRCCTPLHVGGFGDDPDTDLPVARDGRGRCYVPGTSLAGVLRQWCRAAFPNAVDEVWGFQEGDDGHASFVTVDDLFVPDDTLIPEVRDGVGISRRTGAAAESIKYDRAVLPRGTLLPRFAVTAEVGDDRKALALAMLAGLKDALAGRQLRLGASKTRGLGKVELLNPTLTRVATNTRDGIFALLNGDAEEVTGAELAALPEPTTAPRLDITVAWKPDGPLMVKAGFDGVAADMLPLVSGTPGGVAPVLPGSSIKGALRNRAEQIVRTVRGLAVDPAVTDPRRQFLDDTDVVLVNDLFGARGGLTGGVGALAVDDCYANTISRDAWEAIGTATDDQSLRNALDGSSAKSWQNAYHVAIDRWTGGAAESFLYTVLEPHAAEWETIEITVDPERAGPAGVSLLLLVLRDLAAGRLALGFAANRGLGAIKDVTVRVKPHGAEGYGEFTLGTIPSQLKEAWRTWAAQEATR